MTAEEICCRARSARFRLRDVYAKPSMKPADTVKAIAFSAILLSSQLVFTKEGKAQDRCQAAIQGVTSDIQGRIGAVTTIKRLSTAEFKGDSDMMQTYQSPFNNADEIVVFYLASAMGRGSVTRQQGQAGYNIMNSPQLTRKYAEQIISACDPVASVKFFYWEWYQGWSLRKGNELVEDECKNPDGSNYYWGQNICV